MNATDDDERNRRDTGRADAVTLGVLKLFESMGEPGLLETPLANNRRADVMTLSRTGDITIVEVKSCLADFTSDAKWPDYRPYCDYFYFAVDEAFPAEVVPDTVGLIIADAFGGAVIRESEKAALSAARRKSLTLKFARLAANRLWRASTAPAED